MANRLVVLGAVVIASLSYAQVPDHLECYKVKDPSGKGKYTADLGGLAPEPGCVIKMPAKMLCVESTKANVAPPPPGAAAGPAAGRFACYAVKCPKSTLPAVPIVDQFGARNLQPSTPKLICAPVATPSVSTCRDTLDALGVTWADAPATPGIADPVTVTLPLNGIEYYSPGSAPVGALTMDCRLAVSLHRMADLLHPLGVTGVGYFSLYNYRCIGGGTPPDCPNGISAHALGTAIDVAELRTPTEVYNVEADWVIDPDADPTCTAPTANDDDRILHELVCAWYANGVFDLVLTPNYNADHANHFHLETAQETRFIE